MAAAEDVELSLAALAGGGGGELRSAGGSGVAGTVSHSELPLQFGSCGVEGASSSQPLCCALDDDDDTTLSTNLFPRLGADAGGSEVAGASLRLSDAADAPVAAS